MGERIARLKISHGALTNPQSRAKERSRDGVDFEALMLLGLFWNYHLDEADAVRCCRELNEEVASVQAAFPDRYSGMAVLPMQHPKAALRELDHACGTLGLRTIAIATNICGRNLDDPTVLPVLAAAASANLFICVHPPVWDKAADERLPRYHFANSFGAPLKSSIAAMSVVYSGLLDGIRISELCSRRVEVAIHYGVGQLNHRYKQRSDARPMSCPPIDYLSRMYFDCLVHDENSLEFLLSRAGSDKILQGTDFPATGDIPGGAMQWIGNSHRLSPPDKERILWRNALDFLAMSRAGDFVRARGYVMRPRRR